MENKQWLRSIGMIIYIVFSAIDRFIYKMPDYLYILMAIIVMICFVISFIKDRKENEK